MDTLLVPMQLVPELGQPDLLSTLVVVIVALLVMRILLKVAFKIAVLAALVVGVVWIFGALSMISL